MKKKINNIGEDLLLVSYDCCPPDLATLQIAREEGNKIKVLSTLHGDKAFAIYHMLTGGATIEDNEITKEIMFQLKCVKEHLKFVSQTTDKSVDFDVQVLDGCIAQIEKMI